MIPSVDTSALCGTPHKAENETLSSDVLDCRRVIGQRCELPLPANRLPTCSKEKPSSVKMVFWCLAG